MEVMFWNNGHTMVFDDNGKQVPELQKSYLLLVVKFLEDHGINPLYIEFTLPDGKKTTLFETSEGWAWRVPEL